MDINQFAQLLDVIRADMTKPYDQCRLKDWPWDHWRNIPVTLEPERLAEALEKNKSMEDIWRGRDVKGGILAYSDSDRFPSLSSLAETLEEHPVGKESWEVGETTPQFSEALQRLDALEGDQYILAENLGLRFENPIGPLTLMSRPRPYPSLYHIRFSPHPRSGESGFSVELSVNLDSSRAIEIGKDHIIPWSYCNLVRHLGIKTQSTMLLGYRVNEENQADIAENAGRHHNFRIYTDKNEIWRVVRESVSRKMYAAIREIVR